VLSSTSTDDFEIDPINDTESVADPESKYPPSDEPVVIVKPLTADNLIGFFIDYTVNLMVDAAGIYDENALDTLRV
jgi:hypothetical protein